MKALPSPQVLWTNLKSAWRTELWPLPTIAVLFAVGLGLGLPAVDGLFADGPGRVFAGYLFSGGPDAARTVLSSVAGSLITVTSLTFSLTVVTLQLASSQFSPRLLRTFTRDRFVHVTLAMFLATFTYALAVLRSVRTGNDGQDPFVPRLSVTFAFVLTLASVFALVLFLAHLARQIRVETMLRNVADEASRSMAGLLPERPVAAHPPLAPPPPDADLLLCSGSGFVVYVDEETLVKAAYKHDAVVLIERYPGESVIAGTPLGRVWSLSGGRLDDEALEAVRAKVRRAVTTGIERTAAQDVGYGLRQLTDVAVKALSPGINDPTTAVHALGQSSALLCQAAGRDSGHRVVRDDASHVRAVLHRPGLPALLDLAVAQPRRYGASDPAVLGRLASLLRELAWCTDDTHHRRAVADQLGRLRRTAADQPFDAAESAWLEEELAMVDEALSGSWPSPPA